MGFKLGREARNIKSSKNVRIRRKNLEPGVLGEAYKDGSIAVDTSVEPGSELDKRVQRHENVHAKEMMSGKLTYGDDYVRDGNKTYHRKNGKIKYNGKWHEEGSMVFPWEKRAKKAERLTVDRSKGNKLPDGRPGSSAYQKRNDV
tara:strand:+ start:64 stop:498 length:435 start_codon:yes stop_codon:yes gene_type:complete